MPQIKLVKGSLEVDLEMVYDVSGNDEAFIKLMIETFLNSIPGTMEKIEHYCAVEDWDNLFKSAHFAKSSYSIIKVSGMLELIKQIEINAKSKSNLAEIPKLVKEAVEKFKLAKAMLESEFKSTLSK